MVMLGPPIQQATSDPRGWDEHWEQVIALAYADPDYAPGKQDSVEAYHVDHFATRYKDVQVRDGAISAYRDLRLGLCFLQAVLTREAIQHFVRDRFEERWVSATPAERGRHLLAALCDVCSSAINLHQSRAFCAKEMNVAAHRNDGRLLINLMKEMMVENPAAVPENPVYISHPVWDAIAADQKSSNAPSEDKLALELVLVLRNKLIAHVLQFVLRSFLGLSLPQILVSKHASHKKSAIASTQPTQLTGRLSEGLGRAEAQVYVEAERDAMKALYSKWKQNCFNCNKPNETATKYSRCKRCWDGMQREVLYCSVACQKADWKAGHKATCGRPLKFEDLGSETPARRGEDLPPVVGPPVPSFKRSPTLMYQVARINQSPQYDYFVWTTDYPVYIAFPHLPVQTVFRAARAKALASGDRPAVAKLAHFLIITSTRDPRARSLGVTEELIVKQLIGEYEFEELDRAIVEMKARMARDPLQRPQLLIDSGLSMGEWEEYRTTGLVDVGVVPIDPRLIEQARNNRV